MLLMVLVVMVTVKRELIRSEVHSANILLASIEENLINGMSAGDTASGLISESLITKMINYSQISHALVLGSKGEHCYLGAKSKTSMDQLYGFTQKAITSGEQKIHFMDTSWILFWKLNPRMVIATPLIKNGITHGGVGIEFPLDRVHYTLRRSQQFLLFYIFINLIILTFVGIQRISRPYLQPLARLAKRAADYKEDDDLFFSVRKEDNELSSLSKALNSMLKRISRFCPLNAPTWS
jgi:methyl-accepting chemotaxis protein